MKTLHRNKCFRSKLYLRFVEISFEENSSRKYHAPKTMCEQKDSAGVGI